MGVRAEVEEGETTEIDLVGYPLAFPQRKTMDRGEGILHGRKQVADARFALPTDNGLKGVARKVPGRRLLGEDEDVPLVYVVEVVQVRLFLGHLDFRGSGRSERFRESGRSARCTFPE